MHISSLKIKNYRAIKNITIDFESEISVLVGENGCGKSSVLNALEACLGKNTPRGGFTIAINDFHIIEPTNSHKHPAPPPVQEKEMVIEIGFTERAEIRRHELPKLREAGFCDSSGILNFYMEVTAAAENKEVHTTFRFLHKIDEDTSEEIDLGDKKEEFLDEIRRVAPFIRIRSAALPPPKRAVADESGNSQDARYNTAKKTIEDLLQRAYSELLEDPNNDAAKLLKKHSKNIELMLKSINTTLQAPGKTVDLDAIAIESAFPVAMENDPLMASPREDKNSYDSGLIAELCADANVADEVSSEKMINHKSSYKANFSDNGNCYENSANENDKINYKEEFWKKSAALVGEDIIKAQAEDMEKAQAEDMQSRLSTPVQPDTNWHKFVGLMGGVGARSLAMLAFAGQLFASEYVIHKGDSRPLISVEDPEAYLHPLMLNSVWNLIDKLGTQRLVTTNNPDLLLAIPLNGMRRMKRSRDGNITVYKVPSGEVSFSDLRRIAYHLRVRRGRAMFMRSWLLVEGETEFWILPEVARAMGLDLWQEGIEFIEFAQCGLVPLAKLANHLGIAWHLLADGDRAGKNYVEKAIPCAKEKQLGKITIFQEPDIEHCFWNNGYDYVFRRAAGELIDINNDKSGKKTREIIKRAVKRCSKPGLALILGREMTRPGNPGIPSVLENLVYDIVNSARHGRAKDQKANPNDYKFMMTSTKASSRRK